MKMVIVTLLSLGVLTFANNANAHGTDKLGPNGGYVTMPGAYHVEVVPRDDLTQVYFLDMKFRPLETKDSTISFKLKGHHAEEIPCMNRNSYFECSTVLKEAKGFNEIEIQSTLKKSKFRTSNYKLPLKL